jgi:CheY-like chemotaxis protein
VSRARRHPNVSGLRTALGGDIVSRMPTIKARRPSRAEALPERRRHRLRSEDLQRESRDQPPHRSEHPLSPAPRPGSLPRTLTGLQILVVDDDPDILEVFATALTACGGDVTATDNASDGLALAIRTRPHVIVSDIAMIGEDGYWLIGRLRQLPAEMLPKVPVIAATAYGREHSRSRVLAAGFTEHLQKPVDPEELCQVVAKVASR